MNTLQTSYLDLIFKNRNKFYGAYTLRKNYNKRMAAVLLLGFILIGIITTLGTQLKSHTNATILPKDWDTVLASIQENKPKNEKKVQPQKTEATKKAAVTNTIAAKQINTVRFTNKIEMVSNTAQADKLYNITNQVQISNHTQIAGNTALVGNTFKHISNNTDSSSIKNGAGTNTEMKKLIIDTKPAYPGGLEALQRFLANNLRAPAEAEEAGSSLIEVKVSFIIDTTGTLKKFVVLQSGGSVYDAEVIRVLKLMPNWLPAAAQGHPVNVSYTLPVKFVTEN